MPAELCGITQRAVLGSFKCEPCPVGAICDGSPDIVAPSGWWRDWPGSSAVYPCGAAIACSGDSNCATGYSGLLCTTCTEEYSHTGALCSRCFDRGTNIFLIILAVLIVLAVVLYMSIGSMRARDAAQAKVVGESPEGPMSALSVILRLVITHLQIVGLLPVMELGYPEWVQLVTGGAGRGSQASAQLSFVGCVLGDDVIEILVIQVVFLCIIVVGAVLVAIIVAFHDTLGGYFDTEVSRGLANARAAALGSHPHTHIAVGEEEDDDHVTKHFLKRRKESLGRMKVNQGHALDDAILTEAEIAVAENDNHYCELQRNHRLLLEESTRAELHFVATSHVPSHEARPSHKHIVVTPPAATFGLLEFATVGDGQKPLPPSNGGEPHNQTLATINSHTTTRVDRGDTAVFEDSWKKKSVYGAGLPTAVRSDDTTQQNSAILSNGKKKWMALRPPFGCRSPFASAVT